MKQKKEIELGAGIVVEAFFEDGVLDHVELTIPKKSNKLSAQDVMDLVSWLDVEVLRTKIANIANKSPLNGPNPQGKIIDPKTGKEAPKSVWDEPKSSMDKGLEDFDLSGKIQETFGTLKVHK